MSRRGSARDRILDAAERLTLRAGPSHVTLEAVAAEAGISKGGLLYHFPSQAALMAGMLDRFLERMDERRARVARRLRGAPGQAWLSYLHTYLHLPPAERRSAAALLNVVVRQPELLAKVRRRWRGAWEEIRTSGGLRAAVLLFSVKGMWLADLLGISELTAADRHGLRREILRLAREWEAPGPADEPAVRPETPRPAARAGRTRRAHARVAAILLLAAPLAPGVGPAATADEGRAAEAAVAATVREKPAPLRPLRARDSVALALERNPRLQAVRRERDLARGRILESYALILPHLGARGGYTRLDEPPSMEFAGRALELGSEHRYSAELILRQPVYRGGAIAAGLRAARWAAEMAEAAVAEAEQQTILAALKDHVDTWLAASVMEVHRQALEFAEAMRDDVVRKRRQGLATDYDVLRAEVEVSRARAQWLTQKNDYELTRARWRQTLGLSTDEHVVPADEPRFEPAEPDWAALWAAARQTRPDLRRSEFLMRAQEEAWRSARAEYAPSIALFAQQQWARPDPHSAMRDEWGDAWTVGVQVEWALFDGLRRRGRVQQERARLDQARWQHAALENQADLELRQALLSIRNTAELVRSQALNRERAAEGLRMVREAYRQGTQNELAVLDAQTALTQAQVLYQQALHAHVLARLALLRATGLLDAEAADQLWGEPAPQASERPPVSAREE